MTWKPLFVRLGQEEEAGPYEGVPAHLYGPLIDWLDREFITYNGYVDFGGTRRMGQELHVVVPPGTSDDSVSYYVKKWFERDKTRLLVAVDWVLYHRYYALNRVPRDEFGELRDIFEVAASVYTIAADGSGLTTRVDGTAAEMFRNAVSAADEISAELREAWARVYSLSTDPSDAWDHAIKAVEEALKPIITPTNNAATLGGVIGQLRSAPAGKNKFLLVDNSLNPRTVPLNTFIDLLSFVWVNPDRHGGANKRVPTLDEARAVVHAAVLIVQYARMGVIY